MGRIKTLQPQVAMLKGGSLASIGDIAKGERMTGRPWMRLRRRILRRDPLCRICACKGITKASTEVDHIVPLHLGGTDEESNLQGVCADCHAAKSAAEQRARLDGTAVMVAARSPRKPTLV